MYYEAIELINYIGLYNGLGLHEIKIDFMKCKNNKILIVGPNGSGKSTIISSIHPFPDSNDRFVPNMEARKNLILVDDNIRYIISYIHPVNTDGSRGTTKGYISKIIGNSTEELNPSGNVSSCKELISALFDFDSGFNILSQISSEDRGLVDRKPADRKRLISYILNSLDTYNSIYKIITKKYNVVKSLLNTLTTKISMIGDEEKIRQTLNGIIQQLSKCEEDKTKVLQSQAKLKMKKDDLEYILEQGKYDEMVKTINRLDSNISQINQEITNFLNKYNIENISLVKAFLDHIQSKIIKLESEINLYTDQIQQSLKSRDLEYIQLQDKSERLKSLQSDIRLSNIESTLNDLYAKAAQFKQIFDSMGLNDVNIITKDEFRAAMEALQTLKYMSENIQLSYSMEDISNEVNDSTRVTEMLNSMNSVHERIKELEKIVGDLAGQYTEAIANRKIAMGLQNRPKKCKIDTCIYISEALRADREYPESRVASIEEELHKYETELEESRKLMEHLHTLDLLRYSINSLLHELNSKWPFISKLPVKKDFVSTFLSRLLSYNNSFQDIESLYKYIDHGNMLEEYQNVLENIKTYESELKLYRSKEDIINSIASDIEILNKKISELNSSISTLSESIKKSKSELEELTQISSITSAILDKYENILKPMVDECNNLKNSKSTLEQSSIDLKEISNALVDVDTYLAALEMKIKTLNNEKESLNHSLILLSEYKKEYASYIKEVNIIEKVRYYSSPTTGIQNIYLTIFMNKILTTANQLLGYLFNGRYMINNFIINETEFKIPCIGDSGMMHDDISNMSTAEKSMLSMIISFALLNQSSSKYNILCLDEIDGALDYNNRSNFIIVLDQIMQLLQVQQVFIISHNSELDYSFCDIINLSNNVIPNANIIWHI